MGERVVPRLRESRLLTPSFAQTLYIKVGLTKKFKSVRWLRESRDQLDPPEKAETSLRLQFLGGDSECYPNVSGHLMDDHLCRTNSRDLNR